MIPFIQVDSSWYVITDWRPDDKPLPYRLSLRQLSDDEIEWLMPELDNAVSEVWAKLFPTDSDIEHGSTIFDEEKGDEGESVS